ncbi:molecular chaperone TorD family protein [Robertmurraya sp. DFI.2.37]|uniref:TorD/DmsD family molecular chaperone n=1 Tax=Robertmurraya sp. DFI.2.37 TaxID=3031819 RepID=UPI001243E8BD|nr:molecular chaperone TorD family protein [Robertmurraya sp. DFI.2.37]MDF1510845.1 molecular chaperone TorD family protein [Robertmurraya sp. DFI.2.37]
MTYTVERIKDKNVQLLKARKDFYQLQYILFSQPMDLETYFNIKDSFNIQGLQEIDGGKRFYHFFISDDEKAAIEMARDDYFRLFIGPDSLLAPPWESVYRGKDRCLFDFPTFEVKELFKTYHLALERKPDQHIEAEDHISYELQFMIQLIERTEQEHNVSIYNHLLDGQKRMLKEHLAKWVPSFSSDIQNHAKSELFISSARMLEDFIIFDMDVINELYF